MEKWGRKKKIGVIGARNLLQINDESGGKNHIHLLHATGQRLH